MIYIPSTNGVKIATYDYNPGGRESVFLVHGWPLTHEIYEYQIERLIDCGYRVVAVDLRGFGHSDVPASGYSYDQMAADLYAVIRTLRLRSFTLVGFSMGGAIVLRYMRRFQGFGVKKLILLSAAAPSFARQDDFPFGMRKEAVNRLICLAATDRPQLAKSFSHEQLFATPKNEAQMDWFEQIALSASGIATVQTAIALRDEDGREDLPCVHVPTRIIHGAKDIVVSHDLVRLQQEGIAGARLVTLENSGHGVMYDELERFNQVFLEVIRN